MTDFFSSECREDAEEECSEFRAEPPLSDEFNSTAFEHYCRYSVLDRLRSDNNRLSISERQIKTFDCRNSDTFRNYTKRLSNSERTKRTDAKQLLKQLCLYIG